MSAIVRRNEKIFEHFYDTPPEIRRMFIDSMQPDDRVRFTRCSKISREEAKSSKNYIHSLRIYAVENYIILTIQHNEHIPAHEEHQGFCLKFRREMGLHTMRCVNKNGECWKEDLHLSIDLLLHAAGYFKQLLGLYQNQIKGLEFSGFAFFGRLRNYDFGIDILKNLKNLYIVGNMNVLQYFSKLRKPLKRLSVDRGINSGILSDCEEVYQVQNYANMTATKFTYEQMLQLSAPHVSMSIDGLNERDVFNFIRSWQNGTLGKHIECYLWRRLMNSSFNYRELLRLLDLTDDGPSGPHRRFEIKNFEEIEKKAVLITTPSQIQFEIQRRGN